jgi:MFS family permease
VSQRPTEECYTRRVNAIETAAQGSEDLESAPTLFASLKYPGSKRYFGGLALSMVGTWMQSIALAWLVVKVLKGGGRELGLVSVFQFGPMLVLGMYAGSLSDRFDKRVLMLITQLLMGSAALALFYVDLTNRESMGVIYALSGLSGLASAFDTPVRRSLIGDLVPKEALPNAMSLNTGVMTSTRVLGMAIGGYVVRFAGTEWCFLANGVSYLAMLIALTGLSQRTHATTASPDDGGVRGALVHVWRSRELRLVMIATAVVATVTFNYQTTFPLMIKNVFHGGADSLGTLFAVTSLGSFLGALTSAKRRRPSIAWFLLGVAVMGVGAAGVSIAGSLFWGVVASLPMGVGGGLLMAQMSGLLTSNSQPTMRGRVLALQSVIFLGSTPIGGPIVGAIADGAGARWASGAGAIAAAITAVGGWFAYRRLVSDRSYRSALIPE